jgi:hypothetical protein
MEFSLINQTALKGLDHAVWRERYFGGLEAEAA